MSPIRSRRCNDERALKTTGLKSGKVRRAMSQSQKNCLDFSTLIQRVTGTGSMKLGMAFLFCGKVFYFRGDNIEK